ncbi:putative bel1-like homeodomain protein 8 protein [Botrytis fragariae]|uniref:Putative bel1-like homeodomain protein 8 protein n=1 Tax=Botrytis fragariae TaxID=1964551 RepID=A0A8H6AL06_9HELO|nr:putative bel1-like homeodomain protein 8 protein [Botrytis fragariae]KAF5869314.1 putative bel1-like homeodomain protein 8 protein [Botrytis fragariae]
MLSRTLTFGPVAFSSLSDKLSLQLEYEVVIRLPSGNLETLSVDQCLKALTSGEMWVASGNSCRIDFVIDLDGKESFGINNNHIIEMLGKYVAESKIWEQLGLSAILHLQNEPLQTNNLSLQLNNKDPSNSPILGVRPWTCTTTDIRIPDAQLCAHMEQLKVRLSFRPKSGGSQTSKRRKPFLLDSVVSKGSSQTLKVAQSGTPKKSLVIKFGPSENISSLLERYSDASKRLQATQASIPATSSIVEVGSRVKISEILKECSESLSSSIALHAAPALSQLSSFISSGPFSKSLLTSRHMTSPSNSRKRMKRAPEVSQRAETSPSTKQDDASTAPEDITFDKMLLPSSDERHRAQVSNKNPLKSSTIGSLSQKCNATFNSQDEEYVFDPTASCKLVTAAIQVMIAGIETRQRTTKGVKIDNIPGISAIPLAALGPVMFSPGFKKSVAQNSRYTPRIIQMMTSFARNAQTPGLRQKIEQIANMPTSAFVNKKTDEEMHGELGSEKRLTVVVKARLWSMMQRTLHDLSAARQIINKRSTSEDVVMARGIDECEDLLDSIVDDADIQDSAMVDDDFRWIVDNHSENSSFDNILSDDEGTPDHGFDDLLLEDDVGFYDSLLSGGEMERLTLESDSEEMFFGHRWQLEYEEQYDDLLLVVEGSGHDELLLEENSGILEEGLSFNNDDLLVI